MIDCLVSFGTNQYFHRQLLLGASAVETGVVRRHIRHSPKTVKRSGFGGIFPDIDIRERGAGFWAWKPMIIRSTLESLKNGESLLYCDVGRTFPFKILDTPLDMLEEWMDKNDQSILPGVSIPWHGTMAKWTKRDAFVLTDSDSFAFHRSAQIQASFSIWRKSPYSMYFVNEWLNWCKDRRKISDDLSVCGLPELQEYIEHRHDQSLSSILCAREGVRGFDVGADDPSFDEKDPCALVGNYGAKRKPLPLWIRILQISCENAERAIRRRSVS